MSRADSNRHHEQIRMGTATTLDEPVLETLVRFVHNLFAESSNKTFLCSLIASCILL